MADQRSTPIRPPFDGAASVPADGSRRRLLLAAGAGAGLAGLGVSPLAAAQSAPAAGSAAWPNKPVRVICNFAAGGLTDSYARQYSEALSRKFGQNFIVDNRPGAGGLLGADLMAKSPADGYTFLVTTTGPLWASRGLYRKLPYDPVKDFIPVTLFPSGALVMAVHKDVPVNSAKELAELAKAGNVSFGTYGQGSWPHMVTENWIKQRKIPLTVVHYKGESLMWVDIASGQIQAGIGSYLQFAIHHQKGLIKPLGAATGQHRSPKLPDLPTLVEQGFDDPLFKLDGFMPMVAPVGTPADIIRKVADAIQEMSDTPKLAALRDTFAIDQWPTNYETTLRRYKDDAEVWASQADALGIKLDA